MRADVLGAGLYANGFVSFQALCEPVQADPSLTAVAPRPALVPPRELRRLPDAARLGVEVATQACAMAGIDPSEVVPVFTSTIGDSAITDYMCRTLAGEQKLLSPLRFQNSVHNAPGGSLSIITGNRHPGSFVAAFEASFALALLEALVLSVSQSAPVLLVCTDVPVPAPLSDVHGAGALAGCALLMAGAAPDGAELDGAAARGVRFGTLQASVDAFDDPDAARTASADEISTTLPATTQGWPLIEALARRRELELCLPVGAGSALRVALSVPHDMEHVTA